MEEGERGREEVDSLMAITGEVSGITEFRFDFFRREFVSLSRRVRLLSPLLEDVRDCAAWPLPDEALEGLASLRQGLESARDLLRFGSRGSKVFMVLKREELINRFQKVNDQLEQALSAIPYDKLDISDEVREQAGQRTDRCT